MRVCVYIYIYIYYHSQTECWVGVYIHCCKRWHCVKIIPEENELDQSILNSVRSYLRFTSR